MSEERISIRWEGQGEDCAAIEAAFAKFKEMDPGTTAELTHPAAIAPLAIVAGAVAVVVVAEEVLRIVCKLQKPGMRYDTTAAKPVLRTDPAVPNGTILIVKPGSVDMVDACGLTAPDLAKLLAGALSGAEAPKNGAQPVHG